MNKMNSINRRTFLTTSALTLGVVMLPPTLVRGEEQKTETGTKKVRTAADQVELGNTGIKLSRLGFGAGTNSGAVQREIGHEEFNKVIRHAYDCGITYFDTAESYQTHTWLKEALKGIPREKIFIQTKMPGWGVKDAEEAFARIEKYLKELGTDYIDSLLIHCQVKQDWNKIMRPIMDAFEKAKEKKMIRAHGVSTHSLPAIRTGIEEEWCETMLIRVNPQGHITDSETEEWNAPSSITYVPEVKKLIQKASDKGKGVIAMKLCGNGDFTKAEDREKAMRYAMKVEGLDAAVIGFKSIAEVDESIERMNNALKEG